MRTLVGLTLLLAPALLGAGCRNVTPVGTVLATSPPGARVVVDGRDSGYVTPCVIDFERQVAHDVRLELAGYEQAIVFLTPDARLEVVSWYDGQVAWIPLFFGGFLPILDLLQPFRLDDSLTPSRVFVRLRPRVER